MPGNYRFLKLTYSFTIQYTAGSWNWTATSDFNGYDYAPGTYVDWRGSIDYRVAMPLDVMPYQAWVEFNNAGLDNVFSYIYPQLSLGGSHTGTNSPFVWTPDNMQGVQYAISNMNEQAIRPARESIYDDYTVTVTFATPGASPSTDGETTITINEIFAFTSAEQSTYDALLALYPNNVTPYVYPGNGSVYIYTEGSWEKAKNIYKKTSNGWESVSSLYERNNSAWQNKT